MNNEKNIVVCANVERYAEYLVQRGFNEEAALKKARQFVNSQLVELGNRFWLDGNDELELYYIEDFPVCRRWEGAPLSTEGTQFVAYSPRELQSVARVLDTLIERALQSFKPPSQRCRTVNSKPWPRGGTIAHDVLSYLRDCKVPVTQWDIEMTVAHTSASAVSPYVYRALVRLLARGEIYITPLRVRGVQRRGFVAKGSPADATLPPEAPRYNEWKAAGEL